MGLLDFAVLSVGSLFVIVDPIGLVPVFLAMSARNSREERIRMAALASTVTFFILLAFAATGSWPFEVFGVTFPAFEIAGGIILLIIALDMLRARRTAIKETPEEEAEGVSKDDIAVTPLAIPMLAGPGAITDVILLSSKAGSLAHQGVLVASILFVSLATFLILRLAAVRSSLFGVIALKVITRLMGLLLASISIQFILNGIQESKLLV